MKLQILEAGAQPGPACSFLYGVAATPQQRPRGRQHLARSGKTLILIPRWTGTAWKQAQAQPSANSLLDSVSATSADCA